MKWKFYAKYMKRNPTYSGLKDNLMSASRKKKMKKFKKKYGFDYSEVWNLDSTVAGFMLPRVAYLRDHHVGYPSSLCNFAEDGYTVLNEKEATAMWNDILDTIVRGLYIYVSSDFIMNEEDEALWKQAKEYLFKYFEALWD